MVGRSHVRERPGGRSPRPVRPPETAFLADFLTAALRDTLARTTQLSHAQIPDPQKLLDSKDLLF